MAQLLINPASEITLAKAIRPWGLMGGKTVNDTMDAYRMIGWSVTKEQLQTTLGEKVDTFATIRHNGDGTRTILGDKLGPDYKVLQNTGLMVAASQLVDMGCVIRKVGEVNAGQKVWILLEIPQDLVIGKSGNDVLKRFVLISNDHCGRARARVSLMITRLACTNGATVTDDIGARMRHQGDLEFKFANAVQALDVANLKFLEYGESLERLMVAKNINQADVNAYVKNVFFPRITEKDAIEKQDTIKRVQETISRLYTSGPGADLAEARGTAYGLYQAVNHYLNYESKAANRQVSLIFGAGAKTDSRALELATHL